MDSYEAVIDPELQDISPPPPPTKGRQTGTKRKAALPQQPTTTPATNTRLTRRQAAAAAAAIATPDHKESYSPRHPGDEPSRGEEENLIGYEWANAKRSRRRSPSAHGGHSSRPHTPSQWTSSAHASAHPSAHPSPGHGGIDNLAAAAAAYQSNTPQPPPPRYPYPFGLTPFRYPCLTPHLPPPPPGDPTNPNFQAYDPYHGMERAEDAHHEEQQDKEQLQQHTHHHHHHPHHHHHQDPPEDYHELPPVERTEHTTLAALLSATEAANGFDMGVGSAPSSRPRTPADRGR